MMITKFYAMVKRAICSSSIGTSDWSNLPGHLLDSIIEKLFTLSDYIRFSAVCKTWNSIASDHKQKRMHMSNSNNQLPWQLVSYLDHDTGKERLSLYNYFTSKISNFKLHIPDKYNMNSCCGSSHGWLIFSTEKFFSDKTISLVVLNPLYGTTFHLPPLSSSRFSGGRILYGRGRATLFGDVALSKDPFSGSFEVIAINCFRNVVAHLKFGDEFWSYSEKTNSDYFKCVGFYKDRILAACSDGNVVSLELFNGGEYRHVSSLCIKICGSLSPKVKRMCTPHSQSCLSLVESTKGDFLMVYADVNFCFIYKIVDLNGRFVNIPVVNLDGYSLFMGKNHSILVLASNYPGCRPNSVYYSYALTLETRHEGFLRSGFEIEEFNLEDGSQKIFQTVEIWTENRHNAVVCGLAPWIVPSMKF